MGQGGGYLLLSPGPAVCGAGGPGQRSYRVTSHPAQHLRYHLLKTECVVCSLLPQTTFQSGMSASVSGTPNPISQRQKP